MEKTFIRVRSIKDIVISASLALAGIILTVLPVGDAARIAGFFIIIAAAILAFVLKSAYKDVETNEKYLKKERYFQQTMHAAISSAIELSTYSDNVTSLLNIVPISCMCVCMCVWISHKDNNFHTLKEKS